jgi:hypothetical protein
VAISTNQFPEIGGNMGPATGLRLPLPKQSESLAVPTDQGVRLHDRQRFLPLEIFGKSSKGKTNPVGGMPGFLLSLNVKAKLFPQKQIFSGHRRGRSQGEAE